MTNDERAPDPGSRRAPASDTHAPSPAGTREPSHREGRASERSHQGANAPSPPATPRRAATADGRGSARGAPPKRASAAGAGSLVQQLRLWSGLVLFSFALGHFLNHALGLVSRETMEAAAVVRTALWQSVPGTVLLYGAIATHVSLALLKTLRRRTWRMPLAEAAQLALGLLIPVMLIDHVVGTRIVDVVFGISDEYRHVLSLHWPGLAWWQSGLLLVVWTHAMIGLHFWLRMKRWFPRAMPLLLALAVLVPALALAGWISAARRQELAGLAERALTPEAAVWAGAVIEWGRVALLALIGAAVLVSLALSFGLFQRDALTVTYPGGRRVRARAGQTLLEVSRENNIAHTSVCGGRARCSTCRTRIEKGLERLPAPAAPERQVLQRIGAAPDVRLACQTLVRCDLTVAPLLPRARAPQAPAADDTYRWGTEKEIAVLFVDVRGFTSLSERRLPFDVVFILNEYLNTMAAAVRRNDGLVDKFIGDSVMALFGIASGPEAGARRALLAAADMLDALGGLNARLSEQLSETLDIGIGIHAGSAILGRVGVGDGSGGITALGDTVNTASRLEGLTKEVAARVVVSETVAAFAGAARASWRCESVLVRGRATPLTVHPLDDPHDIRRALAGPAAHEPTVAARTLQDAAR